MTDPSPATPAAKPHHPAFGWQMSLFFVTLLLVFVYLPIDINVPEALFALMFSIVLLAAVFAVRTRQHWRAVSVALALTSITLSWAVTLLDPPPVWLSLAAFGVSALFIIYTTSVIIVLLPRVQSVTVHTIAAALSLYLLLGILGGVLFTITEVSAPGSLASGVGSLPPGNRAADVFPALLYFSFSTLTTVGLGDIYPVSPTARALAILEAVAGQIYLVVMVAVLVSMFASERARRDERVRE
jgi:hypothetical protein